MGFPSVCYCVILPKPLIIALQLLDMVKDAVFLPLFYLGLAPDIEADQLPLPLSPSTTTLDQFSSSPADGLPSMIKDRLPAVKFSDLLDGAAGADDDQPTCAVCLGGLEARHEVRELGNCCHAFHRWCIDKWVDRGQMTCPLCRSMLLPTGLTDGSPAAGAGP